MDGVYRVDLDKSRYDRIGSHESYVSSVGFLKALGQYVSAGYDGVLQWFQQESQQPIRQLSAHQFWSWDMAVSPDQRRLASVTGQYLAGGYKYEPSPEREPSVRVYDTSTGELQHSFSHTPSVQAVSFSNDSRYVAAGNLLGEVRIWDCESGEQVGSFATPDLTSWGIIKSHCYLGGVFCLRFAPDDASILICGMGDMRDPMAGNGRQMWQRWTWREEPQKLAETKKEEAGEGLMEALAVHPNGATFVMGGRLRGGDWNVAAFDLNAGMRLGTIKSGYRVTELLYDEQGTHLLVVGGQGQPGRNKEGKFDDFGRVEFYEITS
jgi:hypothetical protein